MYAYCGNNSVLNIDSRGDFFFTALGAITGFVGSMLTTAALNVVTGSNDDIFTAGVNGAIGGAISGAGVDIALVVIGSFGTALPVVALAAGITFTAGGIGNAFTTYLASNGEATDKEMSYSFWIGGTFNLLSLGLSASAVAKNFTGVSIAGMQQFESNMKAGLAVATSTGIATEIGTSAPKNTSSSKANRMKYCYKNMLDVDLFY